MPARLGHWQSQTSNICSEMTGQWSDSLLCQATRHCHHQVQWATCAAWHWDLGHILKERRLWLYGHVERSSGAVRTAFDIQVDRKHGPGNSWQRGIAESGSSRLSTLMIDIPGDLVWDLPWVQQASYLEGGPLVWMLPLYLHVNQKSGPSCPKLTMSLVNDLLKCTSSDMQICWNFLLKKCE